MTRSARINPAKTTMSTPPSTNGENADVPDIAILNRSTRYVNGEQYARASSWPYISLRGTNIPEIKISGNRIRCENIL
jgi:hypothetical protein